MDVGASTMASGGDPAPVRVLVVDDNRDILLSTRLLLEVMGHEALTASSGMDCLGKLPSFEPDLVLLDIAMPGMDGMEVVRGIRDLSLKKEPALAAMTGYATPAMQTQCAEAGFDHYLVKPVDVAALDQLIHFAKPERSVHGQFLSLQARHKDAVCAFTKSQLEFCELVLDLADRLRRPEDKERQLRKVDRSLANVSAWLDQQPDLPKRQWHALRSQFAVLKYRLAAMKE